MKLNKKTDFSMNCTHGIGQMFSKSWWSLTRQVVIPQDKIIYSIFQHKYNQNLLLIDEDIEKHTLFLFFEAGSKKT